MAFGSKVFLMYHELEMVGRSSCRVAEGYIRYVIPLDDFRSQLLCLKRIGLRGMNVTEALNSPGSEGVAITFDDGCETNLLAAAPLLKDAAFGATFYVTVGFLGSCHFLSTTQVRELSNLGFEIGCHSMSHAYLTDASADRLHAEVCEAKTTLEEIIGRRVDHFSCPGGRWNRRVAQVAKDAGYVSVATSRIGTNSAKTDPFNLARVPIKRGTNLSAFERVSCGEGLWQLKARDLSRSAAKHLLGNSNYDKIRDIWLTRRQSEGAQKS